MPAIIRPVGLPRLLRHKQLRVLRLAVVLLISVHVLMLALHWTYSRTGGKQRATMRSQETHERIQAPVLDPLDPSPSIKPPLAQAFRLFPALFQQQRQLLPHLAPSPPASMRENQQKVAIVTLYKDGAAKLKPLTEPNKKAYALRHRYAFHDAHEDAKLRPLLDAATPETVMFTKFLVVRHYLDRYDWVFWTDADSLFLNHSRTLVELMDGARFDVVLPVGHAMDWHWGKIVNMGHFLVRSTPFSRDFMEQLWDVRPQLGQPCPGVPDLYGPINHWLHPCSGMRGYWLGDQGGIHALVRSSRYPSDHLCHIQWRNMRDVGSEVPFYGDGDLVVHLPGRSFDNRKAAIAAFHERANFTTGVVRDKSGPLQQQGMDWRVQRDLDMHYRGAGWNIPCQELLSYYRTGS